MISRHTHLTWRNALMALAVAVTLLVWTPSSHAGTVQVNPNLNADFTWGVSPGAWNNGLSGWSMNLAAGTPGTYLFIKAPSTPLPSTVNLDTMYSHDVWATGGTSYHPFGVRMCYGGASQWSVRTGGACAGDQLGTLAGTENGHNAEADTGMECGSKNASAAGEYRCGGYQLEVLNPQGFGYITVYSAQATLSDYVNPTIDRTFNSNELVSGNWLRGSVTGGLASADSSGVGVQSSSLSIAGSVVASKSYDCNYTQWLPCPATGTWSPIVDTSTVVDGPHLAAFTTTDAAANTQASGGSFTIRVDNTKPATPDNIVRSTNGTNGWSSDNVLDVSWTNSGETIETATQSGIEKVIVDVNPTDSGSQSDPAPIAIPVGTTVSGIAATRSSAFGITVPAAGAWKLRLQLVDKAGNVSDAGDGTGSDSDIGYDPNPPAKPAGQNNGWISRDELAAGFDQSFAYVAPPTSSAPLCGFAGAIDDDPNGNPGSAINVPGGGSVRKWRLPGTLTEATHYVHLRSVGCNGVASPTTETVLAPVDRTDAVGTITGVENGKWYKNGKSVTLSAVDDLSGMAPADALDSDARHGAYLAYSINLSGPADQDAPRGDTTTINVTGEGPKGLDFSPVDFAGNKAAPKVATFGIDATNPTGYISQPDSARPTLLSAPIADAPSGVDYAIFSIRKVGSSDAWQDLPTSLSGADGRTLGSGVASGTATARFPDTELPAGTYDVRVSSYDLAGNELATQKLKDGSNATVQNPMRGETGISVKLFKAVRSCSAKHCAIKKCPKTNKGAEKFKGACYRVLKGKVDFVGGASTVAVAFNRGAIATGAVTAANGTPLRNTDVVISTTETQSGKARVVDTVKTDANGVYTLRIPAGVSRQVKAHFPGTELLRDATATANMGAQAKLKLKISKRHAYTGQTVTFSGKVTSFDGTIPAAGKIIALQFYAAKKWRPAVAIAHTDAKGNFSVKYKFDGKRVKAKIIFRVVAPSEDGWGHVSSASLPVKIKLN